MYMEAIIVLTIIHMQGYLSPPTSTHIQYLALGQDAMLQRQRPKLVCLMLNPVHNHSATMPPPLIPMIGVEWTGSIGKGGTLITLRNQ